MGIFNWIGGLFFNSPSSGSERNPATGLPMIEPGTGGVDVAGNPYGTDLHRWHDDHAHSAIPDTSATTPSPSDWNHWSNTTGTSHDRTSYDPWRDY